MRTADILLTALGPAIWGTTYLVTTEWLPPGHPITDSLIRALPAGLLLLAWVRELPRGDWIWRVFVLAALNFAIFWWLLFVSAYRLPGGVAAVIIAAQPVIVLALSRLILKTPLKPMAIVAGLGGIFGVALLILQPGATLEPIGILASVGGALSMALGTVLARLWQPPVSALTFTAWQLVAGGLLLLPFALIFEAPLAAPSLGEWLGYLWLGLFGAAISYVLWFRGIARLGPSAASPLVLMSPVTAVLIGAIVLGERFTPLQIAGVALVLASVWGSQRALAADAPAASPTEGAPAR